MAMRRNIRLRKEYLYRKSLEGKEREAYERKERIRQALADGRPIPTDLRKDADALRAEMAAEDDVTAKPLSHIDDEYAYAGSYEPKVCVTTSHDPSSRLKQFAKEVRLLFPNSQRINRGGTTMKELVDVCRANNFTDIVLLQETRGEPDAMIVSHLPHGPTISFSMSNCVLRRDIGDSAPISEQYPHLIFHNFKTTLGNRIANALKFLFPVCKESATRLMTFSNENDYISFRHHNFKKDGDGSKAEVTLDEVGPRFELMPYQVRLGTLEQTDAEVEWVLRPFMNTASKRTAL